MQEKVDMALVSVQHGGRSVGHATIEILSTRLAPLGPVRWTCVAFRCSDCSF